MEMQISVDYQGYPATYKVMPEQKNIYLAELLDYFGCWDFNPPPEKITLTQGVRHWIGSIDNQNLIGDLGLAIEVKMASSDYIGLDNLIFLLNSYHNPRSLIQKR